MNASEVKYREIVDSYIAPFMKDLGKMGTDGWSAPQN